MSACGRATGICAVRTVAINPFGGSTLLAVQSIVAKEGAIEERTKIGRSHADADATASNGESSQWKV